jgi:hypothetical protein
MACYALDRGLAKAWNVEADPPAWVIEVMARW